MSVENMSGRFSLRSHAAGGVGAVIRPHSACDEKTVMESLVHFLQDVVSSGAESTTSSKSTKVEGDAILWARFETSDLNELGVFDLDPSSGQNSDGKSGATFEAKPVPSLLLILGYANGAQIWSVASSGEAKELFSLKNGPIKALKLLPHPDCDPGISDRYSAKRPLVAISESTSPLNSNLKFVSLTTGEDVHAIAYKQPILDLLANRKVVVASFVEKFVVLDSSTLSHRFWVGSCFPSAGPNLNPIALSSRWLAYADTRFVSHHQSYGGVSSASGQSYTSTVISAAKSLSKGLTALGETVASSLSGGMSPTGVPLQHQQQPNRGSPSADGFGFGAQPLLEAPHVPGVVSVLDVTRVEEEKFGVTPDTSAIEGLVAHFLAHANEPIAALAWNQSGQLLFTADRLGHCFHIFKILSHPLSSSFAAVHHLYTLRRGETTSKVQDVAFSLDSRWVAVSTFRGTTHVFPITPYGGPVTSRTHLCSKVVNRASRFHKSAGIDEIDSLSSPHSPSSNPLLLGSSPSSATPHLSPEHHYHHHHVYHHSSHPHGNPRVAAPPSPNLVHSVAQIKQPLTLANAIPGSGGTNPAAGTKSGKSGNAPISTHHHHHHHQHHHGSQDHLDSAASICVATVFGKSRGWLGQHSTHSAVSESPFVDALFVMGWHGGLLEYILDPHPAGLPPPSPTSLLSSSPASDFPSKIADETRIEVVSSPRARWMLRRLPASPEFPPPLPAENPLLTAAQVAAATLKQNAKVKAASFTFSGGADRVPSGVSASSSGVFLGLRGPGDGERAGGESVKTAAALRRSSEGDSSLESDDDEDDGDDQWLSQVEMVTYEGPHRRLWMGPQFAFKVVNPATTSLTPSSSALFADVEPFVQGATIATLDQIKAKDEGAALIPGGATPWVGESHGFTVGPPVTGGAAPCHASAGRFDSLMLDVNLESLKVSEDRSNPVDMPPSASGKGRRRPRTTSNKSDSSEFRRRNNSGNDSSLGSGSANVVEVFGSWPDSARPEMSLGAGVGIDVIGEEISDAAGMPQIGAAASEGGQEKLLQESLADAMLEAALGVSGSGGGFGGELDHAMQESSGGGSSQDASGEFFIASEDLVLDSHEIRVDDVETYVDPPSPPHSPPPPPPPLLKEEDFDETYGKGFSLSNEEPFSLTMESAIDKAVLEEDSLVNAITSSMEDSDGKTQLNETKRESEGAEEGAEEEEKTPFDEKSDSTEKERTPTEKDKTPLEKKKTPTEREKTPTEKEKTPTEEESVSASGERGSLSNEVDPNDVPFVGATSGKKKGKKKKK